jgi:hypothetical protein
MTGTVTSTLDENHIRSLALDPSVHEIVIPAGGVSLTQPILGRDNLTIRGQGPGYTWLTVAANFLYHDQNNAAIHAQNCTQFNVMDMSINCSKLGHGGLRLNAITHKTCNDFDVQRVAVENVSGYGFWPVGIGDGQYRTRNARYLDIQSKNANVHFEPMRADDILLDGLTYGDGDGDIACEAAVHPLVFGRNHIYRRIIGLGSNPAFNIVCHGGEFDGILIENSSCVSSRGASVIVSAQGNPIKNVVINDSQFNATNNSGTDIEGGEYVVSRTKFKAARQTPGPLCCLVIGAEAKMICNDVTLVARISGEGNHGYAIVNQNTTEILHFNGGELRTVATNGAYGHATGSALLAISPSTLIRAL